MENNLCVNEISQTSLYYLDDMNLNGISKDKIILLCEKCLPLKTKFVKLVLDLQNHPKLIEWISKQSYMLKIDENARINLVIEAIKRYSLDGKLVINLNDGEFWKCLVDVFMELDDKPKDSNEKFENSVIRKVNHTMRSCYKNGKETKKRVKQKSVWI